MDVPEVVRLAGVPMPLRWSGAPLPVQLAEDALTITTGPRTDWFVDPATGEVTATGSALLGAVPYREFTFTAQVSVDFATAFDAGALVVRLAPDRWAKLAYEISTQGQPTVVTVVMRGRSDDATGLHVDAQHGVAQGLPSGRLLRIPRLNRRGHLASDPALPLRRAGLRRRALCAAERSQCRLARPSALVTGRPRGRELSSNLVDGVGAASLGSGGVGVGVAPFL